MKMGRRIIKKKGREKIRKRIKWSKKSFSKMSEKKAKILKRIKSDNK